MTSGGFRPDVSTPAVVLAPAVRLGTGHGIARSLGRLGVPVFGVHSDPRAAAARSRYWRRNFEWDFARAPAAATVARLLEIAAEAGGRPLLVPADDSTCLFVADHASELRQAYRFQEPPAGLVRGLSSKRSMYELCSRLGVPTAETYFPESLADVSAFARTARFPVMLKGIDTFRLYLRTGVRMVVVGDAGTLLRLYGEMEDPASPNLMLQEYVPGGSDEVWMFDGYFDGRSDCLFGLTARKLRQYPAGQGVTSLGVCEPNHEVRERTVWLMRALGYRGVLDIGYKRDPRTGEYLLLDVNPRIGVSFRLFVDRAGMDVSRALYLDLTGQPVPTGAAPDGRRWLVENFDLVTSWRELRDGTLTPRGWLLSLRGVEETSWFALDDWAPAAAMATASAGWAPVALARRLKRRRTLAAAEAPVTSAAAR